VSRRDGAQQGGGTGTHLVEHKAEEGAGPVGTRVILLAKPHLGSIQKSEIGLHPARVNPKGPEGRPA